MVKLPCFVCDTPETFKGAAVFPPGGAEVGGAQAA